MGSVVLGYVSDQTHLALFKRLQLLLTSGKAVNEEPACMLLFFGDLIPQHGDQQVAGKAFLELVLTEIVVQSLSIGRRGVSPYLP